MRMRSYLLILGCSEADLVTFNVVKRRTEEDEGRG